MRGPSCNVCMGICVCFHGQVTSHTIMPSDASSHRPVLITIVDGPNTAPDN